MNNMTKIGHHSKQIQKLNSSETRDKQIITKYSFQNIHRIHKNNVTISKIDPSYKTCIFISFYLDLYSKGMESYINESIYCYVSSMVPIILNLPCKF